MSQNVAKLLEIKNHALTWFKMLMHILHLLPFQVPDSKLSISYPLHTSVEPLK